MSLRTRSVSTRSTSMMASSSSPRSRRSAASSGSCSSAQASRCSRISAAGSWATKSAEMSSSLGMSTRGPDAPNSSRRSGSAAASSKGRSARRELARPAQVVPHRADRVALGHPEVDRCLGVLPLGQLATALALALHQRGDVGVADRLEAEGGEQLQVQRHRRDPLVAAQHEGHPHEVVVDGVGEVVGRQREGLGRALQQHDVVAVVVGLDAAPDGVVEGHPARFVRGAEADRERQAGVERRRDPLGRRIAPDGPLAPVAEVDLGGLLALGDVGQLLLGREVGVGAAGLEQGPHVAAVDLGPLGLAVRAPRRVGRLGGLDAEVAERPGEVLVGARRRRGPGRCPRSARSSCRRCARPAPWPPSPCTRRRCGGSRWGSVRSG